MIGAQDPHLAWRRAPKKGPKQKAKSTADNERGVGIHSLLSKLAGMEVWD